VLTRKELLSYVLQLTNGLIPLVAIPLISRENGAEGLATFFILLSISGITQIVCDYGFNTSAIRDSTQQLIQDNRGELLHSLIVGTVLVKLIIAAVVIVIATFFVDYINNNLTIDITYIQTTIILSTLISVLNQNWYLYSIQKTHNYNAILFTLKLGSLVLFVYSGIGIWGLLIFILGPNLMVNIYSTLKCWRDVSQYRSKTRVVDLIKNNFQRGGAVFLNTLTSSGITILWPLFIGLTATNLEVSLFGLADKVIKGFMMFVTPLPAFILAKKQLKNILHTHYLYHLIAIIILGLLPAILVWFLPQRIFTLILGADLSVDQGLLCVLTLALPVVISNSIFYVQLLLKRKEILFSFVYPIGTCLSVAFVQLTYSSTVFTPLISEIFVFFLMTMIIAQEQRHKSNALGNER